MTVLAEISANRATRLARNAKQAVADINSASNETQKTKTKTTKPVTSPSAISDPHKQTTENKTDPPAKTTTSSKKRAAPEENSTKGDDNDDAASDVSTVDMTQDIEFDIRWDCNQLRCKLETYLRNTDMNQTQLQHKLNVSPNSYRTFMRASGRQGGMESNTFVAAHTFFSKREDRGLKMPRAKKRKTSKDAKEQKGIPDIDDMPKLDGEEDGAVKVYDTCDDIRTKIDGHLRKYSLTKAAFARELSKCTPTAVAPDQITRLLSKKGPLAGNANAAFYASYVYFEKLRLKEGKAKSKKRQEMEEVHGNKGIMIDRAIETVHFKMLKGDSVSIDKYGHPRHSRGHW